MNDEEWAAAPPNPVRHFAKLHYIIPDSGNIYEIGGGTEREVRLLMTRVHRSQRIYLVEVIGVEEPANPFCVLNHQEICERQS
jgi:hypothetical protein